MLLERVRVDLHRNNGGEELLTNPECDKIANILKLAAWEAVQNDLQERLDIAFPGQFTVKVDPD